MPTEALALLIPIFALCIPIVAIIAQHRHKIEEMRLRAGAQSDSNLASELRDLKNQMAELRDTTTRYDMSFDSALQRIESRVGNLENRVTKVEQPAAVQSVGQRSGG